MKSWRDEWAERLDDMCEIKLCAMPIVKFPFQRTGKNWVLTGVEMSREGLEKLYDHPPRTNP